ncbi:MAG: NAD+ synthase [Planctomycetes bacterium]|nr:NAD+ synthase [Planctomycetota bacterium]
MSMLKIAQAQINPTVGDLDGNAEKVMDGIRRARDAGAHVVVFPELVICGYPPEDLLLRPRFLEDTRRALQKVAESTRDIVAVVGFADESDGRAYNGAAVIENGHVSGVYHKVELPNYGVFDEKRYFEPGISCRVFEACGHRIAVTICEDIWVEGGTAERFIGMNKVRVVLNLSASPFHADKFDLRRKILGRFAKRTNAFLCYTNLVGGQDELVFDGGSLVIGPDGRLIASAKRFEEYVLITVIETGAGPQAADLSELDELYKALVLGTRDYTRKNGFQKVVIGLSGGVDSSLTAAVAVDALGRDNVIGVTMPSHYTSSETRSDAERLAQNLGIRLITVPIKPVFDSYEETLGGPCGGGDLGVAGENLQARIRGNLLMALSNHFGWLVLSTGNKSEMAVGYCTLYGDMAGGFAVIKDVLKTIVYDLSRYSNEKAGREIIPASVLDRAPTAELRPNQTDQDSLPPYEVLDPILAAYVEQDKAPADIIAQGYDPQVVRDVARMVDRSEYKRRQAPPGVKISPKAFGRDRRLPISNHYRP